MKKKPLFRKEKAYLYVRDRSGNRIFEAKGDIDDVMNKTTQKFGCSGFNKMYNNVEKFGEKIKKRFKKK